MVDDSEVKRIKRAYSKREEIISSQLYSFFNDGYLYMIHNRDVEILRLLKSHNIRSIENSKILDIGCGTGAELRNLIRYGATPLNLYGIDLLENRIEVARRLSPNIHFKCADASAIPYEDNSFDIILQYTVFTSIMDDQMKKRVAREMVRVAKNGGIILWYDFYINNPQNADVKGVKVEEISALFTGCCIKLKRITLAPPIARIIAPYSMIVCHMLEKLTLLNTHYLGIIKKTA